MSDMRTGYNIIIIFSREITIKLTAFPGLKVFDDKNDSDKKDDRRHRTDGRQRRSLSY